MYTGADRWSKEVHTARKRPAAYSARARGPAGGTHARADAPPHAPRNQPGHPAQPTPPRPDPPTGNTSRMYVCMYIVRITCMYVLDPSYVLPSERPKAEQLAASDCTANHATISGSALVWTLETGFIKLGVNEDIERMKVIPRAN